MDQQKLNNGHSDLQTQARKAVWNASLLLSQRGLFILGNLVFAALIPRLMGPENFGRYTLIISLSIWFGLFSNMGLPTVILRYIPKFAFQNGEKDLKQFFSHIITVNLISAGLSAALYLLLIRIWLEDLDPFLITLISGTVLIQSLSHSFFTLFLSLNQAARWGMQELLERWISLFFLIPGYYLAGLRGACAGILLSEVFVLSIGLWYGKPYFSLSKMGLRIIYLIPYLRFGLIFFATNLLFAAVFRSGELLIRFFFGDYAQVGFFGVALSIYFTILSVFHKFGSAFTPLLTNYLINQEIEALKQWVENLLKWLAIGGILIIYGILMLGDDLIPLVLGSAYRPVLVLLLVLSISLLPLGLNHMANLLTLIYEKPKIAFIAATLRLTTFWGFGIPLITWFGGLGACIALLTASILYAFYLTPRMQNMISYSLKRWFLTIALGCPFLLLIGLRSTLPMNIALYGLFLIGYGFGLFFLRIITLDEIIAFWQVIRARNLAPTPFIQLT